MTQVYQTVAPTPYRRLMPPPPELTDLDLAMLTFERTHHFWTFAGHHESAILAQFGVDMTTYHARLHRLIHRPEALAHDPITVGRLLDREAAKRVRRLE